MYCGPMIAKLNVRGRNRGGAVARMRDALDAFVIRGVSSSIALQAALLQNSRFISGNFNTGLITEEYPHGVGLAYGGANYRVLSPWVFSQSPCQGRQWPAGLHAGRARRPAHRTHCGARSGGQGRQRTRRSSPSSRRGALPPRESSTPCFPCLHRRATMLCSWHSYPGAHGLTPLPAPGPRRNRCLRPAAAKPARVASRRTAR